MNQYFNPQPKTGKPNQGELDRYKKWLKLNCTCCFTGYTIFENAHIGGLAELKGFGIKSKNNTILPMRKELHDASEGNNDRFFDAAGIPKYKKFAERLFVAFEANKDPTSILDEMQEMANREFITSVILAANGPTQISF